MSDINTLLTKKAELVKAAEEIRARVFGEQNGEWRGDDEKKYDGLLDDAEKITEQTKRLARLESAQRSLDVAGEAAERRTQPNQTSAGRQSAATFGKPNAADRALAFQGWIAGSSSRTRKFLTDRHREAMQRCGVSAESAEYTFNLALEAPKSSRSEDWRAWEQRLTQVDVVSPDYGGHYTVPDEILGPLEKALLAHGGIRRVATILRTNTGATYHIPTLNDTSNTGALLGEGLEHTELDVTFNQVTLDAYKYTSRRVGMSVEYLQDNAINAAQMIGSILGERIARKTNADFTTGDGSSKPNGVVTAAANSSITTSGATTITYDNIIDLKHSVDPAYRENGKFMFNDTTLKILKKIKVAQFSGDSGGWPLWRPGLQVGEPDTIDGDEYVVNQQVASGTGTKAMLYGDFSKYIIRDVREVTLVRLDERYAELGVVAFLAFSRHDGELLNAGTNPIKYLTMG